MVETLARLDHDTRQRQIVDAAREIVARGGSGALTVHAIADRVGVSEAGLYKHVDSKDEVLPLLIDDVRESLLREVSRATGPDGTALAKLERLLGLHLSYAESRGGISFICITAALQFGEARVRAAVGQLVEDCLALVEGIVAEGQRRGEVRREISPSGAATALFGMV
ncbi:MAG: TetR family transcriptional regulator [Gemmatimonadetes bacterium]|nr:TetR family transcriptional regulator [Gemmatimonadota bacterium]